MREPTNNLDETTRPQCSRYALVPQLLFSLTAPLLLGLNQLATFAPGDNNSLGRELLSAMSWKNTAISHETMQALSLKTSLVSLFPAAVLFSLYTQFFSAHLTDHEERELSEAAKLPIIYKKKKEAFRSAASYLAASNIPAQSIGVFLFAFLDEKKSWSDSLYITPAIALSTFAVTAILFFFYKITLCLYALFEPKTSAAVTQRTIETQTNDLESHTMHHGGLVITISGEPSQQEELTPVYRAKAAAIGNCRLTKQSK